jgi:sodium transport system permease protein
VIGKWGAVFALGLLIAVLSCLSFLPAQSLLRSESLAALFRFGWVEAAWFIGLLAPLAALIAALMMAVAIRCKTVKEAQANMVVLTMAFTLTPLLGFFTQEGEAAWNLWVPSVAQTTLMDRVLKNAPIGLLDVAPSLLLCVVLTAAALMFVTRQLARRAAQ